MNYINTMHCIYMMEKHPKVAFQNQELLPRKQHWSRHGHVGLHAWNTIELLLGASGKRWSVETEVRKRKYGNWSTEVRRKAAHGCLVPYRCQRREWLPGVSDSPVIDINSRKCVLRPCSQKVTQSLRCESRILDSIRLRQTSLTAILGSFAGDVFARRTVFSDHRTKFMYRVWVFPKHMRMHSCLKKTEGGNNFVYHITWIHG